MSRGSSRTIPCWSAPPKASRCASDGAAEPRAGCSEGDGPTRRQRRGAGAGDRIDESLETSRSAIEERLGTDLENEFPDDGGQQRRAQRPRRSGGALGMGRRRQRRPRGRRLQSRSLRVGRADAGRSPRRATVAGDRRSGPAHDRPVPDRHGRRGRLPDRRSRRGRRKARRAARRSRGRADDRADLRPARRLRAQSHRMPRASSSGSATASIRRWRRWSAASICSPSATSPRCGGSAASATRISPT